MEFISQDKEMTMPSSLLYSSAIRDSSSTKLLSSGNGTKTVNPSQKFDKDQPLRKGKDPSPDPDPDPDPVPVSISLPTKKNVNPSLIFRYRECLKNHAASIGGHVIDGCGEFMPSSEEDSPDALKCAACNCHRNFHRKELSGEPRSYSTPNRINRNPHHSQIPPPLHLPSLHHQNHKFQLGLPTSPVVPIQPMMMAFGGGGGGTESSSDELNVFQSGAGARPPELQSVVLSKKRFRTKFSQEQKDRMLEFADKAGWRIQKQDEPSVQQFCDEVGVKRQVLKVWMHNNKNVLKKGGNVSLGKHNIDS